MAIVGRLGSFFRAQHLACMLCLALVSGLVFPGPGLALGKPRVPLLGQVSSSCAMAWIFLVQGTAIRTAEWPQVRSALPALAFASVSVLFLTPIIAACYLNLLTYWTAGPSALRHRDVLAGFAVFAASPTTINSGVALSAVAKGNIVIALVVTVLTNVLAVLIVPYSVNWVFGIALSHAFVPNHPGQSEAKAKLEDEQAGANVGDSSSPLGAAVQVDSEALLVKLLIVVLLPAATGIFLNRRVAAVHTCIDSSKFLLAVSASVALGTVVFAQVSSARERVLSLRGPSLAGIIGCAICLHLIFLTFNSAVAFPWLRPRSDAARLLKSNEPGAACLARAAERLSAVREVRQIEAVRSSVVILCSQKTIVIATSVAASLYEQLDAGLLMVSAIVAHFCQVLIDSAIAGRWGRRADELDAHISELESRADEEAGLRDSEEFALGICDETVIDHSDDSISVRAGRDTRGSNNLRPAERATHTEVVLGRLQCTTEKIS